MTYWTGDVPEGRRCVTYGDEGATFDPACPKCGCFVKADKTVRFKGGVPVETNAACKKCGRVEMAFVGYL